ncbi:phage minor head protein [Burkholderia cenocepacia]|uniref:phage head morphogenesis protein n=1 Tax=Burkholderia cenocepacia TaxID=95486 RepID=UPI00209F028C|nr:phage minor head protein [Burkholderia cenocepacia]MCO8324236.1 minor capsid protein [Burkholderia cenocepacia]MCO8333167.1 minor capsid protein [Burkholderia cenocepacia]MCO8338806.1 minor capsid protein [Burkholderia cenocepacia]MCO8346092.1 minor capsid protein [Burkholderia cenocepacia]MCO8361152.1 minor capsid protein [Burkholderia cenocepacia]
MSVQPFGVQAENALANLRSKVPVETERWNDMLGSMHATQFTVAGAPLDVVKDIHASLVRAMESGTTLAQFRKDFDETVQRSGWTYRGKRGWRTELIYRANMHSAYMAGRWQQIVENADRRPYLEYRAVLDSRTRPQHRAWNGTLLPVTSGFWRTHYPPCGWGCRCTTRSYSEAEMKAAGKQPSYEPDVRYRLVTNADGEVTDRVPVGIDPGWDHNVGQSWLGPDMALGQKLASLPVDMQNNAVMNSVGLEYREAMAQRWRNWLDKLVTPLQPVEPAVAGFMEAELPAIIAQEFPTYATESLVVVAQAAADEAVSTVGEMAALKSWPRAWLNRLPALLWDYKAVLVDTADTGATPLVILVPDGKIGGKVPVIRLRVDQVSDGNQSGTGIEVGTMDAADVSSARYRVVSGAL